MNTLSVSFGALISVGCTLRGKLLGQSFGRYCSHVWDDWASVSMKSLTYGGLAWDHSPREGEENPGEQAGVHQAC